MEQIETASMPPGNQSRRLLVSELAASLVILTGITVLIGWVANIPVLKSIMPDFVSMKVNAALCFIFIGIALWLLQPKRINKITRLISFLFSSFVLVISSLTVVEYLFSLDFGLDQLVLNQPDPYNVLLPGRMAISTAICFLLISVSLLMLTNKNARTIPIVKIFNIFVVFILLIIIFYNIADISIYYNYLNLNTIAIHTIIALGIVVIKRISGGEFLT